MSLGSRETDRIGSNDQMRSKPQRVELVGVGDQGLAGGVRLCVNWADGRLDGRSSDNAASSRGTGPETFMVRNSCRLNAATK